MNARLASLWTSALASAWAGLLLGCPVTPIPAEDAPQVLAEQICEQIYACECDQTDRYVNLGACVEEKKTAIQNAIDEVAAAGGSWSPTCAGELARVWSKWECLGEKSAREEAIHIARACELTYGVKQVGEDCRHDEFGDECSPGLACVDRICREAPEFPVPKGGVCEYENETLPCKEGLWCAWAPHPEMRYCEKYPTAGDRCIESGAECGPQAAELYCDWDTDTCRDLPAIGESCEDTRECRSDAYCDGGQDFTCQPRQEPGEGCSNNGVCVADARCVDNICTLDPAVCDLTYWP